MATLWTFGDSLTFGHGCRPDGPTNEYYYNYRSESDDVWPNLLGKMLNIEVKNLGKCGASNDFIIDSIIDNFFMIKPDDVVIIEKSFYQRFDIPKLNSNTFDTYCAEDLNLINTNLKRNDDNKNKLEIETILNYGILFCDHFLFKERQNKRFKFIEKQLNSKVNKILMWDAVDFTDNKIDTIRNHTNGKIKDFHFSFKGHQLFSEFLYKKLYIKPELI
jgi:lysophospholipase L1-like esterase